ncbi:MAG: TraR/DksA C4-type zinc finger protein [Actinomycetota bacterium]|nr:TraR/DksA C4-type zinc finger protein [Actinomycetota bacterium]
MNDSDFNAVARQRLELERDRLTRLRQGIAEETGSDESERTELQELTQIDQHPADVATELFEREKDLSISDRFEAELADIEVALGRIEDGTYESCEVCRQPIGRDRLEAIPHARLCVEHQAEAERTTA